VPNKFQNSAQLSNRPETGRVRPNKRSIMCVCVLYKKVPGRTTKQCKSEQQQCTANASPHKKRTHMMALLWFVLMQHFSCLSSSFLCRRSWKGKLPNTSHNQAHHGAQSTSKALCTSRQAPHNTYDCMSCTDRACLLVSVCLHTCVSCFLRVATRAMQGGKPLACWQCHHGIHQR
jgi:hypothetical protein